MALANHCYRQRNKAPERQFYHVPGLHKNIDSLKSIEGLNLVWVEEAHSVSKESFDKLIPTVIRNKGAQFISAFNPENETDPVWVMMNSKPPNSVDCLMALDDNPWATDEIFAKRAHDYKVDPDMAAWVWGGQLRKNRRPRSWGKISVYSFEPAQIGMVRTTESTGDFRRILRQPSGHGCTMALLHRARSLAEGR